MRLGSRTGQGLYRQGDAASALDADGSLTRNKQLKACLTTGSASHPSGTIGTNLEVLMSPSRLDEGSRSFFV